LSGNSPLETSRHQRVTVTDNGVDGRDHLEVDQKNIHFEQVETKKQVAGECRDRHFHAAVNDLSKSVITIDGIDVDLVTSGQGEQAGEVAGNRLCPADATRIGVRAKGHFLQDVRQGTCRRTSRCGFLKAAARRACNARAADQAAGLHRLQG